MTRLLETAKVFIAGGGISVGRACVERFQQEGAEVSFLDIDDARTQAVTKATGAHGYTVDIADREAVFGAIAFVYDYRLTGLLATSGVVAMIIGLAVQLNITNIFAGVALNLERPFLIGDWVMIHGRTPDPDNGVIGQVIDINWRTTRLRTADDTEIVIPNGIISEKTITNFMHPNELSRFELDFTVDQAAKPERVIGLIHKGQGQCAKVVTLFQGAGILFFLFVGKDDLIDPDIAPATGFPVDDFELASLTL